MNANFRKLTVWVVTAAVTVLALAAVSQAAGARVNTSKSIPVGLYWTTTRLPAKGEYVLFCPPQNDVMIEARRRGYLSAGFCPGDFGFLMKRVFAVPHDTVSITDAGVTVNGKLLPLSAPLAQDMAGRPMPRYQFTQFMVGASELLLMSDVSGTSFDGRYFGPISRDQIRSVIVPVLTW